jgi:TonB-linked SusC/RagA family outer membrane protein
MAPQLRRLLAATLVLAALPAAALAQQTATILGQVIDATTRQALANVQVFVINSNRGAITTEDGRFRITGVAPGQVQVRAARIGYLAVTQPVAATAGSESTLDFALTPTATRLEEVVTTATGETQRARESGNTIGKIVPADVPLAATPSMSSLINGRVAGVTVLQHSGTTGTSQRVRIRGANSVNLANDPLLIVDNVRVNSSAASLSMGIGGQSTGRLNDINPEDIESIEILKGPAASALYGTAAANGVIQITTKRGRAGKTRWNAFAERGTLEENTDFPANFNSFNGGSASPTFCFSADVAAGFCPAQDSLSILDPLNDDPPFRTGNRTKAGLSAAGGSDIVTFFLSGDWEEEDGIFKTNFLKRYNIRSNIAANLRPELNVSANLGYLTSNLRLPINDNATTGFLGNGLLASGIPRPQSNNYLTFRNDQLEALHNNQDVDRFIGAGNATYQPFNWLRVLGTGGIDYVTRHDNFIVPPNVLSQTQNTLNNRIGSRFSNRLQIYNYTANGSATATFDIMPNLRSTTSAGGQFTRELFTATNCFGRNVIAGTESCNAALTNLAIDEDNIDNKTLGFFGSQQFAWRDRMFLTVALRGDQNSAFGTDFGWATYPAFSASWVVSEEPFFPKTRLLNSMRFRAAYGESGLRPGARDAQTFFEPVAVNVAGAEVAGFTVGGLGDITLKPEKSKEWEGGVDIGIWEDRIGAELTYYKKKSRDALIQTITPPSAGAPNSIFRNIGTVRNDGWEALIRTRLLSLRDVSWEATINYSSNGNELEKLVVDPIIFGLGGNTQRHEEGLALGGYWDHRFTFDDANNDGIIGYDEVFIEPEQSHIGNPLPRREISLNTTVTIMRYLAVTAQLDHKGGFYQYNSTGEFRCSTFFNCQELYDRNTPLADQARAIASTGFAGDGSIFTFAGYMERADFVKLRELAFTLTAPQSWASRVGTRGLSLTVAGRNLKTWTDYSGFDPEVNFSGTGNFTQAEFLSQPPIKYWVARVNVDF